MRKMRCTAHPGADRDRSGIGWALLARMRGPAARFGGGSRVYGTAPFFDVGDLSLFVDDKRRAVGHSCLLRKHAVRGGHLTLREIAQDRKSHIVLRSELSLGRSIIGADSKNLCFRFCKFRHT